LPLLGAVVDVVSGGPLSTSPHPARVLVAVARDWVGVFSVRRRDGRVQPYRLVGQWSPSEVVGVAYNDPLGVELRVVATGERWLLGPLNPSLDAGLIRRKLVRGQ
jgi:hypothetical protein